MSGGRFHYDQYRIGGIADDIKEVIRDWEDRKESEWGGGQLKYGFENPETIKEFRKGIEALRKAYIYAQRIDWLLSGDDGEEFFHKRLKEDLSQLEENKQ